MTFLLATPLLILLAPLPTQAGHALCSWIGGAAGHNSPWHSHYSFYCDAPAKVLDDYHVIYECWGMHVADWGIVSSQALNFASPCAPNVSYEPVKGYSPDCDYKYWAVCVGDAQPHHSKLNFQCFYMDGRDSCEWPSDFTSETRPASVQIWHKKA